MVKKSNGKRKGMSKGVQRGPPASNRRQKSEHGWLALTIKKFLALEKLTQFTGSAFNIFLRASVAFRVVPLEQTEEGHYDVPTGLRFLPFCLYKMSTLIVAVYRLGVSLALAQAEEMTPPLLLAVALSLTSVFVWIVSEWSPADTAFMSKNSRSLLKDISREESRKFGKFDSPALCIKVVGAVLLIPMCAVCIALTNGVLFMGLPTSWCRLAMSYGWLNVESGDSSVIWWLIIFLPLEFVVALGPLMTAAYVAVNTFIGQQAIKTYGQNIRKIDVVDLQSRRQVEQLYIRWQVYIQASNNWTKTMLTPLFLGISGAITITLFLTIRFTDAPIFIYILFPILCFSLLFLMALSSYEAVSVTEISQQVLSGQLLSFHNSHKLQLLSRDQRKLVARRAKAFKPIAFPIGPFTEVSYSVMSNIWEEILNQLLFFLSF